MEKGNTEIVSEMVTEALGADSFRIKPTVEYPTTYTELLEATENEEDTPPQISEMVENMRDYDTIFIGFPIWRGDIPMIVRVFLESYDFSGKTIIPFCTHAGSGLGNAVETIQEICPGAKVEKGLAIRGSVAQNDTATAKESVMEWLNEIGFSE